MADLASSPYFLLILFIAAFALPLLYLIWIRNSPRYGREPWPTVLKTFAWGAVFSVIIAIILSILFILVLSSSQSLNDFFARRFQDPSTAIGALVVAPIVEEAAKGVGATAGRRPDAFRGFFHDWCDDERSDRRARVLEAPREEIIQGLARAEDEDEQDAQDDRDDHAEHGAPCKGLQNGRPRLPAVPRRVPDPNEVEQRQREGRDEQDEQKIGGTREVRHARPRSGILGPGGSLA